MRHVYIDLGSHEGNTAYTYAVAHPDAEIHCFEPNEALIPSILDRSFDLKRLFRINWAAAWLYDGVIDLFQSGASEASTVVHGKVEYGEWPQVRYESPVSVPCVDFSRWLLNSFKLEDQIVLKMDIEGGEYDLLERMIRDRSIHLISHLRCEWHQDRFPSIKMQRHRDLKETLRNLLPVENWK